MSNHATYSPSAADRWLNCPGSVPATASLHATEGEHSIYTASGSVIHAMGEELLTAWMASEPTLPLIDSMGTRVWGDYCDYLPDEFKIMAVSLDMIDQAEQYLHACKDLIEPDDIVWIERKLIYSEKLFGTGDLVCFSDERLLICDLKTGAGNLVSPVENKQLMTYAAMALEYMPRMPKEIHLVIVQPPDEDYAVKQWTTDVETIDAHMRDVQAAMASEDINPGTWCKWCPVRASCRALHNLAVTAASVELDGLDGLGWKNALEMAEILDTWCSSVYARANQLAVESSLKIPGYKLVEKRGRKTWRSEKEAMFEIKERLDGEDVMIANPGKLRTPTQLKKELKNIIDVSFIDELTECPSRGNILVKSSDKREEVANGDDLLDASTKLEFFN